MQQIARQEESINEEDEEHMDHSGAEESSENSSDDGDQYGLDAAYKQQVVQTEPAVSSRGFSNYQSKV